jgi:hypothetical protein
VERTSGFSEQALAAARASAVNRVFTPPRIEGPSL